MFWKIDLDTRIKIRKRGKRREEKKIFFWTYFLEIGRFESSKLDSTDPRGTIFFETSRVIYESLKSRLKCVIYEFPSSMAASEKYELYSKPICVGLSTGSQTRTLRRNTPGYLKVCAKTNIFHVCSAIHLHSDFGEFSVLRRNLARWKLFVFGFVYMKRMEMTIQKMETNIENDPTSCNRKRTYPPTNRRERERISIVTKANVKHMLEEMIRM